jgi:hypothetical protein
MRNTVRITKLALKPIQPKRAIATINPTQPAKALPLASQLGESLLVSLVKAGTDANIRQAAKNINPIPTHSGKKPGPGPTSEI